jgi:hypothetical protein
LPATPAERTRLAHRRLGGKHGGARRSARSPFEPAEPAETRDRASLKRWARYNTENSAVLEQEIFPIAATITGNLAVMQYHYMIASEDHKKERKTVTGRYTDVLVKENG